MDAPLSVYTGPSLRSTFPTPSSTTPTIAPALLPAPSLRRGVSAGGVGSGGEGPWAVVSMARKWDETDLLHRLQNQVGG